MFHKSLFAGLSTPAVALLLIGCGNANAPDELVKLASAEVVQGEIANNYALSWTFEAAQAPVTIAMANTPDAPKNERVTLANGVTDTEYSYASDGDPTRRYFFITPQGGETIKTAVRLLPLEGGRNFRDMGGYDTLDGRSVKWGKIYRSGMMADLTAQDYRYLSGLGIQTLCDFRASDERLSEPTQWKAGDADYLTFADPAEETDQSGFMSIFADPNATPDMVAQGMADYYPQIAKQQIPAYTVMFDRLAEGDIPLSFNCSAGKDRAGTAAALILTALGVPRETVIKDYALSETYVDYMKAFFGEEGEEATKDEPDAYAFLRRLPREMVEPLMRSDPRYIETTFEWMDKEYGGAINFIKTELDVTDTDLDKMKKHMLE